METFKQMEYFSLEYCSLFHSKFGLAFIINDGKLTKLESDHLEEVKGDEI